MAKRSSLDDQLRRLAELRDAPDSDDIEAQLEQALRAPNIVAAEAAKLIGELELRSMEEPLLAAWHHFLEDPIKRDAGCTAKTAIIEALNRISFDDPDFYCTGMHYTQLEPAWGTPEDTAVNVRGGCAFGLAVSIVATNTEKLIAITDLLADQCRVARAHAARALADTGRREAIPILRLKVHCGDSDPNVIGGCFAALVQLDAEDSVSLIAGFLVSRNEDLMYEAAAALGEARHPKAVNALIQAHRRSIDADIRRAILISVGLSREPRAVEYLVGLIEKQEAESEIALEALSPSRFYPDIRDRTRVAVAATGNTRFSALFDEMFAV
ncbi:MAG: HEAT repeat domain-containing protein [Planctomycetota bacterium]|nr:HEAT repeat domain-containing protein [Planctomycetota bacterium]